MKVYVVTRDVRDFYEHHNSNKGVFATIELARKYAASSCHADKIFYEKNQPGVVFDDYTVTTTFVGKEFFELVNRNDHHMAIIYSIEEHELQEVTE